MIVKKQAVIDAALDDEPDRTLVVHTPPPPSPPAHPDDEAAVHQALRMLAGACDGARQEDGMGFNKLDTKIGKSLAAAPALSGKQVALGLRIVWKYHVKQLDAETVSALRVALDRRKARKED